MRQLETERVTPFLMEVLKRLGEQKCSFMLKQLEILKRMKMRHREFEIGQQLDSPAFTKKELQDSFEDLLREDGLSMPDETDFDWSWKELLCQSVAYQDLRESYRRGENVYCINKGALGLKTYTGRD